MRTMSITIDEQLYTLLKKTAGPRGMSRYIAQTLQEKLQSTEQSLYQEYLSAKEDEERQEVLSDWDAVDAEGWR
jgi:predicted CopG family antitoxin